MKGSTQRLLFSLYAAQYVGISFFLVALVAILRKQGVSLEKLSAVYVLGIFWIFKFLWAPFIDRFSFGRFGHYRIWLLILQAAMIINLIIIGLYDISVNFIVVMTLCSIFSFLSATQDIAVDGLACRILSENDRGIGNGIQQAGTMLGSLIGAGFVLMIYPTLGWIGCMLIMATVISLSWLQLLWFKELWFQEPSETAKSMVNYKRLISFWKDISKSWLMILVLYPIGVGMAYAIVNPMLVDLGWSLSQIGVGMYLVATPFGMAASLIIGKLIQILGRKKVLFALPFAQALFVLALLIPANGINEKVSIYTCLIIFLIIYSPMPALLYTLMMDHSHPETPATDFTLQASFLMFVGIMSSGISTVLAGAFGYSVVIWISSLMCIIAFITARFIDRKGQLPISGNTSIG